MVCPYPSLFEIMANACLVHLLALWCGGVTVWVVRRRKGGPAAALSLQCFVAQAFGERHLAIAGLPGCKAAILGVIQARAGVGHAALRTAMWVEATLVAVDTRRHRAARSARGAITARLKRIVCPHPSCRAVLPGMSAGQPR